MALFPSLLVGEGQGGGCWRRSLIGYRSHPPLQLSPTRGRELVALHSLNNAGSPLRRFQAPYRHPRARPGDPRLDGAESPKTWVAGPSPAMTDVGDDSGVKQPAPVGPEPFGLRACGEIEGGAMGGPARCCMVMMEEPGGRFAHGFFRRTGGAGSVTARGGDRKVSGGLDPIPSQRHAAWASRRQVCETCHGTVPAPTLRRLASAPLVRSRS